MKNNCQLPKAQVPQLQKNELSVPKKKKSNDSSTSDAACAEDVSKHPSNHCLSNLRVL